MQRVSLPHPFQVFVATGDITESWTRDSAVQLGAIIPRMSHWPALRVLLEGAVRTQVMHSMPATLPTGYQIEAQCP